jgi:hypothetical protein
MTKLSPLKPLHTDNALSQAKLEMFSKISTQAIMESLSPGRPGSLKTRPDGTMIEGHHRIKILRERGVNVETLPREILLRE